MWVVVPQPMWSVVTALISSDIRRLIEIRWSQLSCLPQLIYDKTNARNASWILMYYFHRKYHNNYIRNSREPQFSPSVFLLCAGKIFWKIVHGGFRAMGARRGDFWKIFLGRKIFQENCLEITQNWLNSPRRGRNFCGPKIVCREKSIKKTLFSLQAPPKFTTT